MSRRVLASIAAWGSIGGLVCLAPSAVAVDRFWDSGDGNWISASNWDPNGVPETGDDVFIGTYFVANDAVVTFGLFPPYSDTVTNLTIENGADLDLNGGRLVVLEDTVVGGGFDKSPNPQLIVSPVVGMPGVDAFDTNTLTLRSASQLIMNGGSISIDGTGDIDGVLDNEAGTIFGYGVIDLDDTDLPTARVLMINDGSITVGTPNEFVLGEPTARTLQINAPNAAGLARIDLGGNVTIRRNSTLELNLRNTATAPTANIELFGNSTLDIGAIYASIGGSLDVNSGAVPGVFPLPAAPAVVGGQNFILAPNSSISLDQSDEVLRFESEFSATDSGTAFATISNSGTIHFAGDASISALTEIVASGTGRLVNDFGSTLTLRNGLDANTPLTNDGVLLLGNPAIDLIADVLIDAFTQTDTGRLVTEIGGVIPGQFDSLTVDGNAALEGRLVALLANNFEPILGNSFTVLETVFGNVTGTFDMEILPVFNGLTLDVVYNSQSVVLQVVEALPGDYNDDGVVDAADYVAWRENLGAAAGTLPNDIDGGTIGQSQYNTWRANFGNASGSAAVTSAIVPEPATALLLLAAVGWASAACCEPRLACRAGRIRTGGRTTRGMLPHDSQSGR